MRITTRWIELDFTTWYCNGLCHREDRDADGRVLPAFIGSEDYQAWYRHGKRHRDDRDQNGHLLPSIQMYKDPRHNVYHLNGVQIPPESPVILAHHRDK